MRRLHYAQLRRMALTRASEAAALGAERHPGRLLTRVMPTRLRLACDTLRCGPRRAIVLVICSSTCASAWGSWSPAARRSTPAPSDGARAARAGCSQVSQRRAARTPPTPRRIAPHTGARNRRGSHARLSQRPIGAPRCTSGTTRRPRRGIRTLDGTIAMPYSAWASATSVEGAPLSRSTRGRMCAIWQAVSNHSREAKSSRVQEQRRVGQLCDLQRRAAAEPVRLRQHREEVEGQQQAPTEPRIGRGREREVDVAALEARGQADDRHPRPGAPRHGGAPADSAAGNRRAGSPSLAAWRPPGARLPALL